MANGVSFNHHGVNYALVNTLPGLPFSNNVVYGSTEGVDLWYGGGRAEAARTPPGASSMA